MSLFERLGSRHSSRRSYIIPDLFAIQNRTLEMALEGAGLSDTFNVLLQGIERLSGTEMLTSLLLLSKDGKRLLHCASPSLPPEYIQAADGVPVGPASGSCGTAAYRRQPVIVQ